MRMLQKMSNKEYASLLKESVANILMVEAAGEEMEGVEDVMHLIQ